MNVDAKTKLEREITRFKNFEIETYFEWTRTNMNIPKCIEFLDSHTFPMLAKVIRIAFQTPAGTGNLERFFSTLKYIFTTERSRMSEETLSNEFSMHGRALFHDYIQSLKVIKNLTFFIYLFSGISRQFRNYIHILYIFDLCVINKKIICKNLDI